MKGKTRHPPRHRSIALAIALALAANATCAAQDRADRVRPPVVAGKFYPGERGKLDAAVKGYLADALPPRGEPPIAIVVPHAGYVFSGQIAADAYRQAVDHPVDLVVILGTNHTAPAFNGVSVYQGEGYRTPLGVAPIDQDTARALLEADPIATFKPAVHEREHSVEVQVPFVQVAFPRARIVGVVVGSAELAPAVRFGRALAKVVAGKRALIVASSDLSHYPGYSDAVAADRDTLEAVATLDPAAVEAAVGREMHEGRKNLLTCACGQGPIMAAMTAARALGAKRGIVVSYANSGDTVVGERDRVVGYGAVVFTAGPGGADTSALKRPVADAKAPLSEADKEYLLELARKTIDRYLNSDSLPLPRISSPALAQRRGAFVTLTKRGDLRGCMGDMAGETPLALAVSRMALEAALRDPRFSPVKAGEVSSLSIEISALTPLERISAPGAIVVGRDGVVIRRGGRSAVFLPQVAPEQGWSREEMLDHLCEKAGMPSDCWHSSTEFYTFQAEVFHETRRR